MIKTIKRMMKTYRKKKLQTAPILPDAQQNLRNKKYISAICNKISEENKIWLEKLVSLKKKMI